MECDERDDNLDISHGRCKIFHFGDDAPAIGVTESHTIFVTVTLTIAITVANADANSDAPDRHN
jgi:hypothetical protein